MISIHHIISLFFIIFFLMIRRPPRSTQSRSSAASDVYKRQFQKIVFRIGEIGNPILNIQGRQIALAEEVGFGGTIVLESRLSMSNEPLPCPIGAIDYGAKKPTQDR